MKITKKCPECGGVEIYRQEVGAVGGYGPDLLPGVSGVKWWKTATFEVYVCGSCGYYQLFVPDAEIPNMKEKFERVT